MQYNLFDSFDANWSFQFRENLTEEQKEILKKGLKESEMEGVKD